MPTPYKHYLLNWFFFSLLLLIPSAQSQAAWLSETKQLMGTAVLLQLWTETPLQGQNTLNNAMARMVFYDQWLSTFKPSSEISYVNHHAYPRPILISAGLYSLLAQSLHFNRLSQGAFDITYAGFARFYDFKRHLQPGQKQIDQLMQHVGPDKIQLSQVNNRPGIVFSSAKVSINLGGIAKGATVDAVVALLKEQGIKHALVSVGGDSRVIGDHHGRPWRSDILNPNTGQTAQLIVGLTEQAISTSGDYQRFFMQAGQRIQHIFDPKTGHSSRLLRSATVISNNATQSDALATAIFVMGAKKGLALVESLLDTEAIVLTGGGEWQQSSGFSTFLLNDNNTD